MKFARWTTCLMALVSVVVLLPAAGCTRDDKGGNPQAKGKDANKGNGKKDISKEEAAHGWWCLEHGIVEDDCSLCLPDDEVKKRFKDTGDWCKLHDRAQSQCFLCDPTLYERVWEPKYMAKYNKKPKRPPESEFKKN